MDFSQIRTDHGGPRGSFEQLVCQLARRDKHPAGSTFRRIEGSGGDGGIEAYWLLPDGSETGYQAKYHLAAAQVDWSKIDKSVEAALTNHPRLTRYVIALPCDLTHRTGGKGGGGTGWEKWEARVKQWEKLAAAKGMTVKFEPWTAFELHDRLTQTEAVGLRGYWFKEIELDPTWFSKQLGLAIDSLDDRYHPEDHVELDISNLFLTLGRDATVLARANELLTGVAKKFGLDSRLGPTDPAPDAALLADAIGATGRLLDLRNRSVPDLAEPWALDQWQMLANDALTKVGKLSSWAWSVESESGKTELQVFRRDLRDLQDRIEALADFLDGKSFAAERDRLALVHGRAGSGKSHLLASEAQKSIDRGAPAILLLGQQFHEGALWPQIMLRLGFGMRNPDEFLASLDAAAEASGARALILVDAINEGAGGRLWRSEIGEFLGRLKGYAHIACVVSCRTEYLEAVVPAGLRDKLTTFYIEGFRTPEEQEKAARIYLDRRGIARPATPWLSPEFVNPLFLRSCANALQAEGLHEFPKGLNGTKAILAFYLKSLAHQLDHEIGGGGHATARLIQAVKAFAGDMAEQRRDYLPEERAGELADAAFKGLVVPAGSTWLEVLRKCSLIRKDPDPTVDTADPLTVVPDVIRFSFQRFQEALMAEALLERVSNSDDPFASDQPLHFIVAERSSIWGWGGLVEALSTQMPERWGRELVDLLPGGPNKWWREGNVVTGFAESVRWRQPSAFTDRTLKLLNALEGTHVSLIALLLELSLSVDHPYNAFWLHKNLIDRPLAERDALWSRPLASEADDGHPSYRLIRWALFAPKDNATPETLALCAATLCWFFGTPHRPLRDSATKALTALLLKKSELFGDLVSKFASVNDPYILERVFSAGYGAACVNPDPKRLEAYARLAYQQVFSGTPPLSLLLRDHARGLIQLAQQHGCLPSDIGPKRTEPPYKSEAPVFDVTKEDIEALAAANGDKAIKSSCSEHADFGHYEIRPAVSEFFDVSLSEDMPTTASNRYDAFEREVLDKDPKKAKAFERLKSALFGHVRIRFFAGDDEATPKEPTKEEMKAWAADLSKAEKTFLKLLTGDEKKRYSTDVLPRWNSNGKDATDPPLVSAAAAYLWVARRAYEFGWTEKLFPHDDRHGWSTGRDRPKIERIGKKYQWLALDELLCRLADNNWMTGGYRSGAKPYNYPGDIGYMRDIDPTVLPEESGDRPGVKSLPAWAAGPSIDVRVCSDRELSTWPFESDPGAAVKQLIVRDDEKGEEWIVLFDQTSVDRRDSERESSSFNIRQQEFRILMSGLVPTSQRKKLTDGLRESQNVDRGDWDPIEVSDGPYLGEAPWRGNWNSDPWTRALRAPDDIKFAQPVVDYHWESHLDCSLPNGARSYMPSPWLLKDMGLTASPDQIGTYLDAAGEPVFISSQGEGAYLALIRAKPFEQFLEKHGLTLIWTFISERSTWFQGNYTSRATRRSEAIVWKTARGYESRSWNKDHHDSSDPN